jgi:hypothetical protein
MERCFLCRISGVTVSGPPSPSGQPWPTAEVMAWRASMEDKLVGLRDLLVMRIEAMDKASEVLAGNVNRVPTLLDREVARLQALFDEKTGNIRTAIRERDDQARQDKVTAAAAVELALASLKELISSQNTSNALAIAKAESATAHDLEALNAIISTTKDGLNSEINNLKQRLDRGEGVSRGQKELRQEDHMTAGTVVGITSGVVGIVALVLALLAYSMPHTVVPINPTVGVDSKRVDDLIAQSVDRNRDMVARMDALSARLNALPPPKPPKD